MSYKYTDIQNERMLVNKIPYLNVVVDHPVVEVLSSQMSISSSWLYFKDTIFNCKDWHVKGTTTKIKDENIALTTNLR